MKKRYLLTLLVCILIQYVHAQDSTSGVRWTFSGTKAAGGGYSITATANIESGWHLFSSTAGDDEPNTRVILDSASAASFKLGTISEKGSLREKKEPLLDNINTKYFENSVTLIVPVATDKQMNEISGSINYMAMHGDEIVGPKTVPFYFSIDAQGNLVSQQASPVKSAEASAALKRNSITIDSPVNDCGGTGTENSAQKSLWSIFVLGFAGGLIALLTPCVFPMIPLTVSFFTKSSQKRSKGIFNALMYGFFILLIYVLLSIPFHFIDASNSGILNNISTNVWLNLLFFVVFVAFALSFFGLFEITMPSSFANKADEKSGTGGLLGIFFMALTLAIVSFSCTGPILGSLLAGSLSTNGGAMQLTMGMAGFGLALALPFALFALFPNLLHSLPKSGGWLTTVKIVLGFLELALAVKFLSNADLVEHWGLLKREVFFAVWIIIGALLVLCLFGIIRFKHEGPAKLSKVRIAFAVFFLALTIYLVPGVTKTKYANRPLISGFPPPLSYSVYGKDAFKGVEANVVNDYDKALELSRQTNKPILIDFTGWACVNCRQMEENVWIDPEVKNIIEKNYILVSLFVDDRKQLAKPQQFIFPYADGSEKAVKTVGDKNATFQHVNFSSQSQPLYAIISPNEKLLTRPVGYTPNERKYSDWLKCGIEAFRKVDGKVAGNMK